MNGKINNSVGFTKVDGAIRTLTVRERLNQIIKFKQPQVVEIRGEAREITVDEARVILTRYKAEYLD